MYSFDFNNAKSTYELNELIRMFIPSKDFQIEVGGTIKIPDEITDRDEAKRYLYNKLSKITGKSLKWGILTGVRPVKLVGDLSKKGNSKREVFDILTKEYYLTEEKARLILNIRSKQEPFLDNKDPRALALYVGVPFCPTRCLYCSFPSYEVKEGAVKAYLGALYKEIEAIGGLAHENNYYAESIYIGGGTPTTLSPDELEDLLKKISKHFDLTNIKEFSLEAGRPDTINKEKLFRAKENGVDRVSINPQTTNEKTLGKIGRNHTNEEFLEAFSQAKEVGFKAINADLIAGLPGEDLKDYIKSLEDVINLKPDNITSHILAVKRASKLRELDPDYSYQFEQICGDMLEKGEEILKKAAYEPYYLYRQKQMMDNLENVGYSLPGKESIYNIRIMEEDQIIIGLGAGAMSKMYYPKENRLERIPNVSNYEIYIDRIEDMIERKRKKIG